MVQNTCDLVKHDANVLRTKRHIDAQQTLNRQTVSVLVHHHGHIVETVHVRQSLQIGAVLGQLFSSAVQQPNMRVGALYHFAIKL